MVMKMFEYKINPNESAKTYESEQCVFAVRGGERGGGTANRRVFEAPLKAAKLSRVFVPLLHRSAMKFARTRTWGPSCVFPNRKLA